MEPVVDYYFVPSSPWTYLGHARFAAMARRFAVTVRVKPIDLARVYAVSGGLPLAQRAAQRRSYRLLDLARHGADLGLPIVIEPRSFPLSPEKASLLLVATVARAGDEAAMDLAHALLCGLWEDERDTSDAAVLERITSDCGLDRALLDDASGPVARAALDANTAEAIDAEVFGVPTYVPRFGPARDQRFWGQDRLDFVERALSGG